MIGFGDISGTSSTDTSSGDDSSGSTDTDSGTNDSASGDCVCDWYGSTYETCENQDSGWGWENNQSCIGSDTCNDQNGGGGVVCN